MPPLSAQQIDLLVSTGRISPQSGEQLKQAYGGLSVAPVGSQPAMFPELMGQANPSSNPTPAPQPAPAPAPPPNVAPQQAPAPAPPLGTRGPILPDGALPATSATRPPILPDGALPGVSSGQQRDAKATLDLLGKAASYVSPVVPIAKAINKGFNSAAKTPGVAEALTTGNVTGAGQAALDERAKNAAPAPDTAKPGESGSVEDKQPIADPAVQQALQQQAQQQAYASALKAYNQSMQSWKARLDSNFDGYVGEAAKDRMAVYDIRGNLIQEQGDETSKAIAMQGAVQFNQAMRDQQVEAEERSKLTAKLDDMNRISQDLANSKIDDRHWWSSLSTPQKFIMAIGKVISGAALRKNTIDAVIEHDIKMQMEQYTRKKDGLAAQRNLFTQYMEIFGDKKQAAAASRLAMKQYAQTQLDALAARHAGDLGRNNAELAKAEIEQELEKERYKLFLMLNPAPQAPGMGGGGYNTLGKDELERMFQTPDGRTWLAPTGGSGEDFRNMFGGVNALSSALDRAEQVKRANPNSWFVPGTDANKELRAIQYDMNSEAKKAAGKGENSDKDFAFRMQSIGDISSPNPMPGGGSNLDQARKFVEGRQRVLTSQLNSSGSVGIVAGYGVNPKTGKTERIYQYKGTQFYAPTKTGTPANTGAPPVPGMTPNK